MSKIWQKKGTKSHPIVNDYIINKDLSADKILLKYDLQASKAHAAMLGKTDLISKKESKELIKTLKEIEELNKKGKFKLEQKNEDCHTAIENHLIKKLGDTGKKIHIGRSRNDQILVAIRLFCKEQLETTKKQISITNKQILLFAKKYEFIPMPGYTHTQQAMPSSIGQWAGSFIESLSDDQEIVQAAHNSNNKNPLGSAAGFGTALPIDRKETTKLLNFKKTQINTLYCQNSRAKIEAFTTHALFQTMMTLNKIATDLITFTSKEFDFFQINKSLTTGSSIMPQKQNLDIMEVLRANTHIIHSYLNLIEQVGLNLISGYHKDLKVTKAPLIKCFEITQKSLELIKIVFQNIKPNESKLISSFTTEIFSTDQVNRLVQKSIPFRDAYKKVGESLSAVTPEDPIKNIKSKKHIGATGNLKLPKAA